MHKTETGFVSVLVEAEIRFSLVLMQFSPIPTAKIPNPKGGKHKGYYYIFPPTSNRDFFLFSTFPDCCNPPVDQ